MLGRTPGELVTRRKLGLPTATSDGGAKEIELKDVCEDMGTHVVFEVPTTTINDEGDGKPSATALPGEIYPEGMTSAAVLDAVLLNCFTRIHTWRTPSNWSAIDWIQEIRAHAVAAAYEAEAAYDPGRGVHRAGFVYVRVMGRVLTHCRREWAYAQQCIPGESGDVSAAVPSATHDALHTALESLPDSRRWIVQELFWKERTEANLASELGITQRAVSKRKQVTVRSLREALGPGLVQDAGEQPGRNGK